MYVGGDGKLHFVNKAGADTVLPFNFDLDFNRIRASGGPDYHGNIRIIMNNRIQEILIQSIEGNTNLEIDNDTTGAQIARIDPGTPGWISFKLPSVGSIIKIGVNRGSYYHEFAMKIKIS